MYQEIKRNLDEAFIWIRCWIDNEPYIIPLLRGKSKSDEFCDKILRQIEAVMNKEKFRYQSGKILLPTKYLVLISPEANSEWTGRKREGLEKKLLDYVGSRIQAVSAQATLMPHNYEVKIKAAGNLQTDEIKVIHQWEERDPNIQICVNGNLYSKNRENKAQSNQRTEFFQETLSNIALNEEITALRPVSEKNFCLEIYRYGVCQKVIPIRRSKVTVGRGSPSVSVDVQLPGDAEVSRLHATLQKTENEELNVYVAGRNPVMVSGQMVFAGQMVTISTGENVQIGSYSLCLRN
jgi:hypothetical protein